MTAPRPRPTLLLRVGHGGARVRDLQQRLQGLGHAIPSSERGTFGSATEEAVRAFQTERRIRVDGLCGRETWARLVEAGYQLGDRTLYQRVPMLRGDDVVALQHRLNGLGFDAGREDGIFGPDAAAAVTEFQHNAGLTADGICGAVTLEAIGRVDRLASGSIASLREREALRHSSPDLHGRRVFFAVAPGFEPLADLVARGLDGHGAHTLVDRSGADESLLAAHANSFGADLFVLLRYGSVEGFHCAYFQSRTYRSEAGFHYATVIQSELSRAGIIDRANEPEGMSYPALRETRMAAVVCEPTTLDDTAGLARLFERSGAVANALVAALGRGAGDPSSTGS